MLYKTLSSWVNIHFLCFSFVIKISKIKTFVIDSRPEKNVLDTFLKFWLI